MTDQPTVLGDDSVSTLQRLVGRPLLSIHGTPFVVDGPLICATAIAITSRGTSFDGYHELVVVTSERHETKEYADYGLFAVSRADSDARAFGNRGLMFVDMSTMTIPGRTATIREYASSVCAPPRRLIPMTALSTTSSSSSISTTAASSRLGTPPVSGKGYV